MTATPPRDALLARQLRWLIAGRVVVVTSVLILFGLLLVPIGSSEELETPRLVSTLAVSPFLVLSGLAYGATLLYIALLRLLARHVVLQAYIQFCGDLLLITGLVADFGGSASPFSILYLVVISVASALLRRRAGFLVATAAYVLYAATVIALYQGWLPSSQPPVGEVASLPLLRYNLVAHLFGFFGVAQLTSYLAQTASRAERRLEEHVERFADLEVFHRDVIQSIPSGLMTTDLGGAITSLNRVGAKVLRRAEKELDGRHVTESGLIDGRDWERSRAEALAGAKLRSEVQVDTTGGEVPVGFSMSRLTDAHHVPRGFILVFQDLSDWHQLQRELRLKDRMAAVGELAAGIAHEIGNPLAAISGSAQMLASSAESDAPQGKLLEILLKESQRLDRTIKGFLRFAKPRERTSVRFDIAAMLAEHIVLLRNSPELSPSHRLTIELEPSSVTVIADADQVTQVFWNLVRNALKAMPDGGELRIGGHLRGDSYHLEVADDGCGMSTEEQANLFHPFKSFFDQGSGIGMAIVYGIVQQHGGRLLVDSAEGRGTTVTVALPLTPRPPSASNAAAENGQARSEMTT